MEAIKPPLRLCGEDGNVYNILGLARRAWIRFHGRTLEAKKSWDKISTEATSGDYDHALQTLMRNFDVD